MISTRNRFFLSSKIKSYIYIYIRNNMFGLKPLYDITYIAALGLVINDIVRNKFKVKEDVLIF